MQTALSVDRRQKLRQFLASRAGQHLSDNRVARIEQSLRPIMASAGLISLDALVDWISAEPSGALASQSLDAMLNNETSFFRDPPLFHSLITSALPSIHARRREKRTLRIWSAACSTGQEAFSLAMAFADQRHLWNGWKIEIVGTDLSARAIARAREGRYNQLEIQRGLSTVQMLRYFRQERTDWIARDELRDMTLFRQFNILESPLILGKFDMILCRNLLIYQDEECRRRTVANLRLAMVRDGLLMLGATETILGLGNWFVPSTAYRGLYEAADRVPPLLPVGPTADARALAKGSSSLNLNTDAVDRFSQSR